ncbi:MAG: endolytic transglycosylase MltG [Bryobacterales bacterium]|nr:endolytic transglycosylase MltG [Bryobacterales bacterium]
MKRLLALVLLLGAFLAWALLTPFQGFPADTFVEIPRGTGTAGIAQELARQGVIRYPWQFWLARLTRPGAKLQAGEYRFSKAANAREVFGRIARGDIYFFEFTVPEGSNIFDIAKSLEAQAVMKQDDFLRAAEDPALIRDLAPRSKTLEGFLFPSTYRLTHTTTAADLCKMMTSEFRRQWAKLSAGQGAGQSAGPGAADLRRTVTLASLVEKETAAPEERPLIASVFVNRLHINMKLDCDPTTIYAALLDNRYRGVIHQSDLVNTNPYNTYRNAGLPPGPIANPGARALAAALHPAETKYLYFVAKPAGGAHQFSASIAEHEKAVIAYRQAQNRTNRHAAPHATQRKIR